MEDVILETLQLMVYEVNVTERGQKGGGMKPSVYTVVNASQPRLNLNS